MMLSADGLYFSLPLNIPMKACCLCRAPDIHVYWDCTQVLAKGSISDAPKCLLSSTMQNWTAKRWQTLPAQPLALARLNLQTAIKGSMELPAARVARGRAGSQRDPLQRDWQRGDVSWHLCTHLASHPGSKTGQSHGPHVSPRGWSSST